MFRSLFHNVTNSVGDGSLEHYTLGLEASEVHAHDLARLEHRSAPRSSRREKSNASRSIGGTTGLEPPTKTSSQAIPFIKIYSGNKRNSTRALASKSTARPFYVAGRKTISETA